MHSAPPLPETPVWRTWLGWASTGLFLYLALRHVTWLTLWQEMIGISPMGLAWAACCLLVAYGLRAKRWQYCFQDPEALPLGQVAQIMMVGYLGNNLLPARAGEVLRVYWFSHNTGREVSGSLATIVLERLMDGVILSLGLGLALGLHPHSLPWGLKLVALSFLIAAVAGAIVILMGSRIQQGLEGLRWLPGHHLMAQFVGGFAASRPHLLTVIGLSILLWLLEALGFAGMLYSFHLPLQVDSVLLFMGAANFASLVPAAPAGWGTVEHFTTAILVQAGLARDPVLGMVLSQHLLYFGITTSLGLWSWITLQTQAMSSQPPPSTCHRGAVSIFPPQAERPNLSVIIPAKDEAQRLPRTLAEIMAYDWQEIRAEVWVVDDGSQDQTLDLVKQWQQDHPQIGVIAYQPNRGKGYALKTGILHAQGERILLVDADGATPIAEIRRLWDALTPQTRLAIGSRVLTSAETAVKTVWYRKWMGWVFIRLVQWLAIQGIYDTQCGFKLMETTAAQDIARHLTLNGFSVDVEMLMIAQRRGYGIEEISINWTNQPGSKVNILSDSIRMLGDMIGIRMKAQRGVYERYLPSSSTSPEEPRV